MSSDVEDPIVHKVDVFVSKSLADSLYLFQYPTRPRASQNGKEIRCTSARVKSSLQQVELDVPVNTASSCYDTSKGEAIAEAVDGHIGVRATREQDLVFREGVMDKQVLCSRAFPSPPQRYAIGILQGGQLHLTPVHAAIQLQPSLSYLDKAKAKKSSRTQPEEEDQEEDEAKPKAITVRFARHESEHRRAERLSSFRHHQEQQDKDPWVTVPVCSPTDALSVNERASLYCSSGDVEALAETLSNKTYLERLCPPLEEDDSKNLAEPGGVLSLARLKKMSFADQTKALLINAKVIRFSQLCALLDTRGKEDDVLKLLPDFAWLVQGCWVVRSDLLYPKDHKSVYSGIAAETLCQGRDFLMWKFTQSRFVKRQEITSALRLPSDDLNDMFHQMARMARREGGWEFITRYDDDFVRSHPEILSKEQERWTVQFGKISNQLNLTSGGKVKQGKAANQAASAKDKEKIGMTSPRKTAAGKRQKGEKMKATGLGEAMDIDLTNIAAASKNLNLPEQAVTAVAESVELLSSQATSVPSNKNSPAPALQMNTVDVKPTVQELRALAEKPSTAISVSLRTNSTTVPLLNHGSGALPSVRVKQERVNVEVLQPPVMVKQEEVNEQLSLPAGLSLASSGALTQPLPVVKHEPGATITSDQRKAAEVFMQRELSRCAVSWQRLRNLLIVEQIGSPNGPLSTVSEKMLLEILRSSDAMKLRNPEGGGDCYVLPRIGDDSLDIYRTIILDIMLKSDSGVVRRRDLNTIVETQTGQSPNSRDLTRALKDLCQSKGGTWHLQVT